MSTFEYIFLAVLPALLLLALWFLLGRWGKKHDPMGGKARDIWSTTGTTTRVDREKD